MTCHLFEKGKTLFMLSNRTRHSILGLLEMSSERVFVHKWSASNFIFCFSTNVFRQDSEMTKTLKI